MSDNKYKAGVMAGIKLGHDRRDWPDEIPGLGKLLGGQPFDECVDCPASAHAQTRRTWRAYGKTPLCFNHALSRARAAGEKVAA